MANRDLTSAVKAELVKPTISFCLLFEAEFSGLILRLWTGTGNLSWDSKTWLGNGQLQGVSPTVEQFGEDRMDSLTVDLTGLDATLISLILNAGRQNATGKLWLGFLGEGTFTLLEDPYMLFAGVLNTPEITESSTGASLSLSYDSSLLDLSRPPGHRFTKESQKFFYPDDQGFDYVSGLQAWRGNWGREN